MSKKIVIIANNSGGLYGFRRELISEFVKRNYSVTALTPFDANLDDLRALGITVVNTPMERRGVNPVKDWKLLKLYRKLLHELEPDLVLTYTIKPNVYGGFVCRMKRIPYATNITGLGTSFQGNRILRAFVIFLYKVSLKKAEVVFFENVENRQSFINKGIVIEEQTYLLNGAGVNLEHYQVVEYPKDEDDVRFLFIGRIMKEKGMDELLSAMKRLRQDGIPCTLDVLGYFEEDYETIINQCEKEGWLRFHGYQSDVRPFIANAHCFVLPSWHEGMANTSLECASMGRPLITTDISGCKEAVIDEVSGYLCEEQNADSLYALMKKFVALNQEERKAMGLAGRRHMEETFDKIKVVAGTINRLEGS